MTTDMSFASEPMKTTVFTYLTNHIQQATVERDLPTNLRFVFFGTSTSFPDYKHHHKKIHRYPVLDDFYVISDEQSNILADYLKLDCSPYATPSNSATIDRCNRQKVDKQLSTYLVAKAAMSSSCNGKYIERDLRFICFGEVTKVIHRGKSTKDTYRIPDLGSVVYLTGSQVEEIKRYLTTPLDDGYKPFMTIVAKASDYIFDVVATEVRPPQPYYAIRCGLTIRYVYCGEAHNGHSRFSDEDDFDDDDYWHYYH